MVIDGDEAIGLGLFQILLLEIRRHLAGRGVCNDALAHLVLLRASLDTHLWVVLGGYVGA
jgi:hypothetical protein